MLDLATLETILPDYARMDLAYTTVEERGGTGFATELIVETGEIMVVVQVKIRFTTDATAGPRLGSLDMRQPPLLSPGIEIPALATQGASAQGEYLFSTDISAAFTVGGAPGTQHFVTPLPTNPISAGGKFEFLVLNGQPGDFVNAASFLVLHIPTGPPRDTGRSGSAASRFRELLGMRG